MLPPDHPYTQQRLKESKAYQGHTRSSSSIDPSGLGDDCLPLGKTTRSSRNLTSLFDREKAKGKKNASGSGEGQKVKKSKSATSLSAIFSRPTSAKGKGNDNAERQKDKENQTPTKTPIWAQFTTQGVVEVTNTTKVALNDKQGGTVIETLSDCRAAKLRDYPPRDKPTLVQRKHQKPRPKSDCLSDAEVRSFVSDSTREFRDPKPSQEHDRSKVATGRKSCSNDQKQSRKENHDQKKSNTDTGNVTMTNKGSRVMAAVAVFNGRSKELPKEPVKEKTPLPVDPKAIEVEFESLLVMKFLPLAKLRMANSHVGRQKRPSKY